MNRHDIARSHCAKAKTSAVRPSYLGEVRRAQIGSTGLSMSWAQFWFVLLAVLAASLISLTTQTINGFGAAVSVFLICSLIFQYVWPGVCNRRFDLSDPLVAGGAVVVLAFAGRSFVLITGHFVAADNLGLRDVAFRTGLGSEFNGIYLWALCYATVCWIALMIGYRIPSPHSSRIRKKISRLDHGSVIWTVLFLGTLGWVCRLYFLRTAPARWDTSVTQVLEVGPLQTISYALSNAALVGLCIAAIYAAIHPSRPLMALAAILLLGEFLAGFLTGERTQMFTPAILVLALLGLKRPVSANPLVIVAIPVLLWGVGFTYLLRTLPQRLAGLESSLVITMEEATRRGYVETGALGVSNLTARYIGLDAVAAILYFPPMETVRWGSTYIVSIVSPFIPRFLWPDKPRPTTGLDFARHYFNTHESNSSFFAPTWIGDLTLQFGVLLAPIMMLILGVLMARLRLAFLAHRELTFGAVLYLACLPQLVTVDGWLSSSLYLITVKALLLRLGLTVARIGSASAYTSADSNVTDEGDH